MKINKNNYEIFFIDYFDGNLSAEVVAELFLFLEANPELKVEFENFSAISLDTPEITFPGKDNLRKGEINSSTIQHYLVASLEGDLSSAEKELLEKFLNENPEYVKDAQLYSKTISTSDTSVKYPYKKSLRQPVPLYVTYRKEFRLAIAAMLLLSILAGSAVILNKFSILPQERMAAQKENTLPENASDKKTFPASNTLPGNIDSVINNSGEQSAELNDNRKKDKAEILLEKSQRVQPQSQVASVNIADSVHEKMLLAGTIQPVLISNTLPEIQAAEKNYPGIAASGNEQYLSVWEAIRTSSEKGIRKAIGKEEPALAYADESESSKIRLVDIVSKGMEKISNDKIQMETAYDDVKQSNSFSFSVGKFSIEKK